METQTKYGLRKAEARNLLPETDLVVVPYLGGDLTGSFFGPDIYKNNLAKMSKSHWHSAQFPKISFRPGLTQESIAAAAYSLKKEAKPKVLPSNWLQVGLSVITQDGVWTNTQITDEDSLKKQLNGIKKVNGIYLLDSGVGFAPYETFERGIQDCDTFVRGGLARVLEHQEKTASNLKTIASSEFYPRGVNVASFDFVKNPILRVAGVGLARSFDGRWDILGVDSSSGGGSNLFNYVFGVYAPEKGK